MIWYGWYGSIYIDMLLLLVVDHISRILEYGGYSNNSIVL